MIADNMTVMYEIPDQLWVNRLRKDNLVWLVKQNIFASIEWEFEPPEPGHIAGRIAIRKRRDTLIGTIFSSPTYDAIETWFIRANGQGMDYSQLFLPVVGHLENNPKPIDEPEIRQLKRELANLNTRMDMLERLQWFDHTLSGKTIPYSYPRSRRKP